MLVESNPNLAAECFQQLRQPKNIVFKSSGSSSSEESTMDDSNTIAQDYLQALMKMEISLKTMEVVNKLSTSLDIPFDFIRMYISQCIRDCENTKDKYLQVSGIF